MANYTSEVAKSHKKFEAALKRAKTRQSCLNAYWKHKKDHETLLRRHLKEELAQVNKKKAKIAYR
ncbi:MAG TPA: hypothetical protein QF710_00380 [Candidatus Nitrosopelagicus sp.]|jgi:Zn-finger protein|nr:hypothetical protein [Nitrososphaerota archaeon]HJM13864.1 hypothetical protein [Candidatus Nitrosopelagicus sp.]|tara:strand:- start:1274 stop:1468 length:195 start_codon:yes stop_codon:yes gene_type:complete